jgi:hypothetical protein
MDPVGLTPPESVAESLSVTWEAPSVTLVGFGVVAMATGFLTQTFTPCEALALAAVVLLVNEAVLL